MKGYIERIKDLIAYLPSRDRELGYKYLKGRDFDSLKELIDSAIILIKRNLKLEHPKEEYLNLDLEELRNLKSEVDNYIILLGLSDRDIFNRDTEDEINFEPFL